MDKSFNNENQTVIYLIVGSGRMASHLVSYFSQLNQEALEFSTKKFIQFNQWNRKQPVEVLNFLVQNSTHVLMAISDSSIKDFYQLYIKNHNVKAIHFSGSLSIENVPCAHPLMTFGLNAYSLEEYKRIHFVINYPYTLSDLLPGLQNPESQIFDEMKPYYHALCVIGGNFSTILVKKMLMEFQKLKIPLSASQFYLDQVLKNVFSAPDTALTGPLARKDKVTVSDNIKALENNNDPYLRIYHCFVELLFNDFFVEEKGEITGFSEKKGSQRKNHDADVL